MRFCLSEAGNSNSEVEDLASFQSFSSVCSDISEWGEMIFIVLDMIFCDVLNLQCFTQLS